MKHLDRNLDNCKQGFTQGQDHYIRPVIGLGMFFRYSEKVQMWRSYILTDKGV